MVVNGVSLSVNDVTRLKNSAAIAQKLENRWDLILRTEIRKGAKEDVERITSGGDIDPPDFEKLLIEHYFQVQIAAFTLAEKETELEKKPPRLARAPKSLNDIMKIYDRWKRGLYKPKMPVKQAKALKKAYIAAINASWNALSETFRNGGQDTQEAIRDELKKAADTTTSRAQTIVRTETTRYYNQARRDFYDKGPDVTHYLFIAVRDKGTTPWCTASKINGKRGRSGLVYAKGDPLLDKETPPIHWNCRSELLPLNRFNPSHKKLIEDQSISRRNHECTPLPPGWNK